MGYIGIVPHKEHSPEVLSLPPVTPCIHVLLIYLYLSLLICFFVFHLLSYVDISLCTTLFNNLFTCIAYYFICLPSYLVIFLFVFLFPYLKILFTYLGRAMA